MKIEVVTHWPGFTTPVEELLISKSSTFFSRERKNAGERTMGSWCHACNKWNRHLLYYWIFSKPFVYCIYTSYILDWENPPYPLPFHLLQMKNTCNFVIAQIHTIPSVEYSCSFTLALRMVSTSLMQRLMSVDVRSKLADSSHTFSCSIRVFEFSAASNCAGRSTKRCLQCCGPRQEWW